MKVPWTARRSNKSILKEINPEYSLEGLMLELKLQYFGHLMRRPWCWERLKAGGEGDERGWDDRMASPNLWTWVWASSRCWWWTGKPGTLQSMGSQKGIRLSHWTELLPCGQILYCLSHQGSLIYVRGRFPLIALVFYWQWFNHWHLYCSSWVIKRNLNLSFHNLRKKRCMQCILGRV